MVQGDHGLDTSGHEGVDELIVEVYTGLVKGGGCAVCEDTSPGQGEPVVGRLKQDQMRLGIKGIQHAA